MTKSMQAMRAAATVVLWGLSVSASAATSDEKALLVKLKRLYPATEFTSVSKTQLPGVYEVVMGVNTAYVGRDGRYFLFGHLFDMQKQRDLTVERRQAGGASSVAKVESESNDDHRASVAELPLQDAIKQVHGAGTRTLIVFSDPLCPYCRQLDAELPQLDDVTIYTFLIPILGSNSQKAAEEAWVKAMPERASDLDVLNRNLQLARRLGINATPTLVRGSDGLINPGAKSAKELSSWLVSGVGSVGLNNGSKKD